MATLPKFSTRIDAVKNYIAIAITNACTVTTIIPTTIAITIAINCMFTITPQLQAKDAVLLSNGTVLRQSADGWLDLGPLPAPKP